MEEVCKGIYVGSLKDSEKLNDDEYAFVHATKTVFNTRCGSLVYERENHLFINWVDARDEKYFDYEGQGVNVVVSALDFIEKWSADRKVIIHCDEGKSRSPSIAMMYMAKRRKNIRNDQHIFAEREFSDIYFDYYPNEGIREFLFQNWHKIK